MFKYSRLEIEVLSQKTNFQKDNLEKVLRLIDILKFIENKPVFESLKLKGGTALQLAFFNFKRLSVDIDFDYHGNEEKDTVQRNRNEIKDHLIRYMQTEGYTISPHSKFPYSLDSYVFNYTNLRGNPDNIKIDINYTNRLHVLNPVVRDYKSDFFGEVKISMLSQLELFATKINALIIRTMPRDFYDTYLIVIESLVKNTDYEFLKKMIIFYYVLSNHKQSFTKSFDNLKNNLSKMSFNVLKKALIPVLNKNAKFDVISSAAVVTDFLNEMMILTEKERQFLKLTQNRIFDLSLLFEKELADQLINHPRIQWIIQNKGVDDEPTTD